MNDINLDHIALNVTNLDSYLRFCQDILKLEVTSPITLSKQSVVTEMTKGDSILGNTLKNLINSISPQTILRMNSRIAFVKAGPDWNILLIESKHPIKGYVVSVEGNNIYGFGCFISKTKDTEDLAWDLAIADANFQFGDPYSDGHTFSEELSHNLFITDPDGRIIELVPKDETGEFITGLSHVILNSESIEKSIKFYECLGLKKTEINSSVSDYYSLIAPLGTKDKAIILIYEQRSADMLICKVGGHGLDHISLSNIDKKLIPEQNKEKNQNKKQTKIPLDILMNPEKIADKTSSTYITDPSGHIIECL